MPKTVELIPDSRNAFHPLRRSYRKPNRRKKGRILVRCGCCDEKLEIVTDKPEFQMGADSHRTLVEINGVAGTIDQWRKILCPLLNVPIPS
jgi:hypothetical protein